MSGWFMPDYSCYAKRVAQWNEIAGLNVTPEFQWSLVKEEHNELVEAYIKKDKKNFLKELCDLFVVLSYYIKLRNPHLFEDKGVFRASGSVGNGSLEASMQYLADMIYIEDAFTAMVIVVNILNKLDADVEKALSEVNSSNFSKFEHYIPGCEEEYDNSAYAIQQANKGRYNNVSWKVSNNYVIYVSDKGKILKGPDYREAEVGKYVR